NRLSTSVQPQRPRSGPGGLILVLRNVEEASEIGGHRTDSSGPECRAAWLQMPVRRRIHKQRIAADRVRLWGYAIRVAVEEVVVHCRRARPGPSGETIGHVARLPICDENVVHEGRVVREGVTVGAAHV